MRRYLFAAAPLGTLALELRAEQLAEFAREVPAPKASPRAAPPVVPAAEPLERLDPMIVVCAVQFEHCRRSEGSAFVPVCGAGLMSCLSNAGSGG